MKKKKLYIQTLFLFVIGQKSRDNSQYPVALTLLPLLTCQQETIFFWTYLCPKKVIARCRTQSPTQSAAFYLSHRPPVIVYYLRKKDEVLRTIYEKEQRNYPELSHDSGGEETYKGLHHRTRERYSNSKKAI